jgi:hypothetical protein
MRSIALLLLARLVLPAADLLFPSFVKPVPAVVYELPPAPDRAEAVQFIQAAARQIFGNAKVMDAFSLSADALRSELSRGFVLFSVLSGPTPLFRQVTQPVPLRLTADALSWNDATVALAEARIALIGRNPYGPGHVLTLAAGTTTLFLTLFGPGFGCTDCSYAVYRNRDLLATGTYDANFALTDPRRISLEDALADARQMFVTMEAVHLNLTASIGEPGYQRLRAQTFDAISTRAAGGKVLRRDLGLALGRAAAGFRDSHTCAFWRHLPAADELAHLRFPPFQFGARAEVRVRLRRPDRTEMEATARTLDSAAFQRLHTPTALERLRRQGTQLRLLDDGKVAHLIFPECKLGDEEEKKIAAAFHRIREAKTGDLILDIRGNPGGRTPIVDYLFRFLHAGKTRSSAKIATRYPGGVVPKALLEGTTPPAGPLPLRVLVYPERTLPRPADFFTGRTWLLIDHGTASSALVLAMLVRDYQAGTIAGYETSGVVEAFGSANEFTLKNSGIHCRVSDKRIWPDKPRPGDDRHGVIPDLPLDRGLLAPYRHEPDPALAWLLDRIRKGR